MPSSSMHGQTAPRRMRIAVRHGRRRGGIDAVRARSDARAASRAHRSAPINGLACWVTSHVAIEPRYRSAWRALIAAERPWRSTATLGDRASRRQVCQARRHHRGQPQRRLARSSWSSRDADCRLASSDPAARSGSRGQTTTGHRSYVQPAIVLKHELLAPSGSSGHCVDQSAAGSACSIRRRGKRIAQSSERSAAIAMRCGTGHVRMRPRCHGATEQLVATVCVGARRGTMTLNASSRQRSRRPLQRSSWQCGAARLSHRRVRDWAGVHGACELRRRVSDRHRVYARSRARGDWRCLDAPSRHLLQTAFSRAQAADLPVEPTTQIRAGASISRPPRRSA